MFPTREQVNQWRQQYVGKTVRLINMGKDPHGIPEPNPLKTGDQGVCQHVDDGGQLSVAWQSGRTLRVSPFYGDELEIIEDTKL